MGKSKRNLLSKSSVISCSYVTVSDTKMLNQTQTRHLFKIFEIGKTAKKGDCEIFWDDTTADDGHEIFMIELHESEGIQNWICQN